MKRRAVRSDVFWRQWVKAGGDALVQARNEAWAAMRSDPEAFAAYQRDPTAWARAHDAAWRKRRGRPPTA